MEDFHIYQVFGIFLPLLIAAVGSIVVAIYDGIKECIYRYNKKNIIL